MTRVDLELLDAALAAIDADPQSWNQDYWRCSTGMCLAAHAATVAGAKWIAAPGGGLQVPLPDDARQLLTAGVASECVLDPGFHGPVSRVRLGTVLAEHGVVHVADWTRARLGLSDAQADALFDGDNTREQLQAMRDALADDPDADLEAVRRRAAAVAS